MPLIAVQRAEIVDRPRVVGVELDGPFVGEDGGGVIALHPECQPQGLEGLRALRIELRSAPSGGHRRVGPLPCSAPPIHVLSVRIAQPGPREGIVGILGDRLLE